MVEAIIETGLRDKVVLVTGRRTGTPEDVAEAYAWLSSDGASFVSAIVLPVDGGLVLGT